MAEENGQEIELSPRLETLSDEYAQDPTSRKFLPLAEEYRKSRMYDEAIYICKEGLKHHPDYPPALITLARCYIEIKEYDEARNTLQDLLDKNPDNPTANKHLGELYIRRGDFEHAREHLLKVKKQRPADAEIDLMLKQIDEPEGGPVESVDISGEGELHIEKDELLNRSTPDWIEGEEDEEDKRGFDPDFEQPEEEPVFISEPAPKPVDLAGSPKDDSLDLDLTEGDEDLDLSLSLEGEEEPEKRASLEEEEPVETLGIVTEEETLARDAAPADVDEPLTIEAEPVETEALLEEQTKERVLDMQADDIESLEIEEIEIPEQAPTVATEEVEQEVVDEGQEELTVAEETVAAADIPEAFEEDGLDHGPCLELDDTEIGGDLEEIVLETMEETEEISEQPVVINAAQELEITTDEPIVEAVEAFEEVEEAEEIIVTEELSEEITVESIQIGDEDKASEVEVVELDQLSEEKLSQFPAEELHLDRNNILKEGVAPQGIEVGTLEETLKEEAKEEYEAEADLEFELGEDFVLEGVEGADEVQDLYASVEVEPEEPVVDIAEDAVEDEEIIAPSTRTSAEIYEQQGHFREALNIYRNLLDSDPDNEILAAKVTEIQNLLAPPKAPEVSKEGITKIEILNAWLSNVEAFRSKVDLHS